MQILSTYLVCSPTVISRKIWGTEIFRNFHTHTVLGSRIGNTQYGNFRIFLPLQFYVKSIFVILKPQKLHSIWTPLNFEFLGIFDIFKCAIPKESKFKTSEIVKKTLWKSAKLISRKIRVAGKFLKFQEYLQSELPIRLLRSVSISKKSHLLSNLGLNLNLTNHSHFQSRMEIDSHFYITFTHYLFGSYIVCVL